MNQVSTNIDQWTEFENRANKFLEKEHAKFNKKNPGLTWSGELGDIDFSSPWEKDRCGAWLRSRLDFEGHFHGAKSKKKCQISITKQNRDELIYELISEDLMWLYDPCVVQRIWRAHHGDDKFLRGLGNTISNYFKDFDKRTRNSASDTRFLRLFLRDLCNLGMVDLYGELIKECKLNTCDHTDKDKKCLKDYDLKKYVRAQYREALKIIKDLAIKKTPLDDVLKAPYLRDAGWLQKSCERWFFSAENLHNNTIPFKKKNLYSPRDGF